ncbi:MAG: S-layer homology domain-containing protein [Monoglobales bacterium]
MLKTKRLLSAILAIIMVTGICIATYASSGINPEETAIYINGLFDGRSAIVDGDIYSANGNVQFNNAGDNQATGSIYLNENNAFTIPAWYFPDFAERVVKLESTEFDAPEIPFLTQPEIDNVVDSFNTGNDAEAEKVTQNTYYKKLDIDTILRIDTSDGDKYIVADSIKFSSNGRIEVIGDGSLFLFINDDPSMSGAQSIVRADGSNTKNHVFVNGKVDLTNNTNTVQMHASLYVDGDHITINTTKLYGNVVSNNAKSFKMTGSISEIFGTVYTPTADASIRGSGAINGRIVANSLELIFRGKVTYNEGYASFEVPASAQPVEKYTLTVAAYPSEGGVVTPSSTEVNKGETVTLSVTANEGYEFIGFTSVSGITPDADGNITVSEDISLTAHFRLIPEIPVPEMDIPDGPRVFINFQYAYLYGYGDELGNVGAEDSIKREEAVALVYRLLKQDDKLDGFYRGIVEPYENIESARWSRSALEYMKYIGVYNTSYISAEANITRGKVAKIIDFAFRIKPDSRKSISFIDLDASHKDYHYIKALVDAGVWEGYDDRIRPDDEITRAEFVKTINRIIGRYDEYEVIDSMNPYPDLSLEEWYYNDIMRASFGYYEFKENGLYRINPDGKPDRYSIDYN